MSHLYAGLDWSGVPFLEGRKEEELYVPCVVAVADLEALRHTLAALRRRFGMAQTDEFHGHEASGEVLAAVLESGIALDFRIGALLIDKAATAPRALPNPKALTAQSALLVLRRFMPRCPLHRLWCDEDLAGNEQQAFKTEILRWCRSNQSDSRLKVRFRDSRKSDLIQLADVTAYALSWSTRKKVESLALRHVLREIRGDARHQLIGPKRWEG